MNKDNRILFLRLFTRTFCRDLLSILEINTESISSIDDRAEYCLLIHNLVRHSNSLSIYINRLLFFFVIFLVLINLLKGLNLD